MQIQLTRIRIFNTLLIWVITLAIGSFHIQPAAAQFNRSSFRETARELNLSRSQMQEIAGIMRNFKSEIEEILTPEQFELLQSARKQQQSQTQTQEPYQLQETLNLTDTQSTQLVALRKEMVVDLQEILTPYQVERIMEKNAFY
ncbi:MAG: hypothetical protein AAFY63_07905 [Cyanobacteria bacterium J06643_13]